MDLSILGGFYKNVEFTEPMSFEETDDNTECIGDEDVVLLQKDMEGDWKEISLTKRQLDEPISL
jgi:hypothetical protein